MSTIATDSYSTARAPRRPARYRRLGVFSFFWVFTLFFSVTYTPIRYLNNNNIGLYDDGVPLPAERPPRTCTRVRPLPLSQLGLAWSIRLVTLLSWLVTALQHALADGVFMFGSPVKFVVSGDKPALIQCRVRRSAAPTAGAPTTPGSNAKASTRWQGHHARSRACPKRGDFAPPKLARAQDTPTDRQPAPAPQTRAKAKGKQREALPHQRVDDDEAPPGTSGKPYPAN
ncbi:hypothetical protein EDB83DRAFT_2322213 [Lactarius deliciosus]|nr:hypothetical protein EDB83DRAFT_2322213 [Lactarius deliciosus]